VDVGPVCGPWAGGSFSRFVSGAGIGSGGSAGTAHRAAGTITINTTGTVTASGGSGWGTGAPIGQGSYANANGAGIDDGITQPADASVAVGAAASFTAGETLVGSTLPNAPVYQWQSSTNGGVTWANIAGATAATYDIASATAAMDGTQLRAVITTTGGGLVVGPDAATITYTTRAATLTVTGAGSATAPVVGNITAPAAIAAGQALTTLTAPTVGNGGSTIISQGWELRKSGSTTWASYATGTALDASYHGASLRYCASNSVGPTCTNEVTVTVTVTVTGDTWSGPVRGGGGNATVTISDCLFDAANTRFVDAPAGAPAGVSFPYGGFAFRATGCGAGPVTVRITLPGPLTGNTQFWKHDGAAWAAYPATISGDTVVYTVRDGFEGDDDRAVNGVIVDPGFPGLGPLGDGGTAPIPTLGQWALMLLALLLGSAAMGTMRRTGRRG
jgi:hypothetical protein